MILIWIWIKSRTPLFATPMIHLPSCFPTPFAPHYSFSFNKQAREARRVPHGLGCAGGVGCTVGWAEGVGPSVGSPFFSVDGHGAENQTQTLSCPLRPATQQTRHDAAVVLLLLRRRPRPPHSLLLRCRRPCPPTRAFPPLPPPPLPRASAHHQLAVPLRGGRSHRTATGDDGDAAAPLRRQGQVPRPDHAHHLQSQEIQDEGPLVHEVPLPNAQGRPDPQVARRQAPQCAPQVQVSKAETSEACFSAFSLCKSYKEAQLLRLGKEECRMEIGT